MSWINVTGVSIEDSLDSLLGFIYCIHLNDGSYYYGRKQFWSKRGKYWYESDWREYSSSSRAILGRLEDIESKHIIAVFESKSAIRYAEAYAIIASGSYIDRHLGLNFSFEGSRGPVKLSVRDGEQLKRLEYYCSNWRRMSDQDTSSR